MATKDIGRLYFTSIKLPRGTWPPLARARSAETEDPYRFGNGMAVRWSTISAALALAAVVIAARRGGTDAAVVGWWSKPLPPVSEDEALERAMSWMR